MKKLSIIVPTYNRSSCLKDCIKSIIISAKNFQERVEIIVSDHASSDNTEKVINEIISTHSTIIYIKRKKNEFTDIHFTKIIEEVSTEFFWMIGDDDKIEPDAIKKIFKHIDDGQNLIYCNYSIWSKDFSMLVNKNGLGCTKTIYFTDHNKVLEKIAFNMAYISCVVGKKDHFVSMPDTERETYFGFTTPHIFPLFSAQINNCHAVLLADTVVMNRSGNNKEETFESIHGSSWHEIYVKGSSTIFSALQKKGYLSASVRKANIKVIVDYLIPQTIELKVNKYNQKGSVKFLWKYYKSYPLFYFVIVPILLCPFSILNLFKSRVKKIPRMIKWFYGTSLL